MTYSQSNRGFSLIEMMVGILVAALMLVTLVIIAADTVSTARVQDGSARLQENGRYALSRIRRDVHQMLFLPISNVQKTLPQADDSPGGVAAGSSVNRSARPKQINTYLNPAIQDLGLGPTGLATLSGGGPTLYSIPMNFLLVAHECGESSCLPNLTVNQAASPQVPDAGLSAGARMPNTDVLTSRFLTSFGVMVSNSGVPGFPVPGQPNPAIRLDSGRNPQDPPLNLQDGDPVMVAGIEGAIIFSATLVPGGLAALPGGRNVNPPGGIQIPAPFAERAQEARVFNLRDGFEVVSYFVRLKEDPNAPGRLIGVLVRQERDQVEELVEGVERFDLRFGVSANDGVRYLDAAQMYDRLSGVIGCPAAPEAFGAYNDETMGCLWRNAVSVEVSLLLNTVDNLPITGNEPYRYSAASTRPDSAPLVEPASVPPSALPTGTMLRREFRATFQLKNGKSL